MPDCRVEPAAPSDPKFAMLGEILEIPRPHAFGLAVSLWCLCWRKEYFDGRLKRWTPQALADEFYWKGDAQKLIDAMIRAEVITRDADGTYVAKNFRKRQGPLINKLLAERGPSDGPVRSEPPPTTGGKSGDATGVKLLLNRMRENHITGTPQQKREHAEAWYVTGRAQRAEALIMGEGKGKGIFWLAKIMDGSPQNGTTQQHEDSVSKIRRQFLGNEEKK